MSVTSYMEWALCRRRNQILTPLSPQYIVSCGKQYSWEQSKRKSMLNGCENGSVRHALDFISDYGLELERHFEYRDDESLCPVAAHEQKAKKGYIRPNINKPLRLRGTTMSLDRALKVGPLIVSMNVPYDFAHYGGGVIDRCDPGTGHAMLVVGLATEDNVRYLIVKNSFGNGWGYDGYLKLSRTALEGCVKQFISPVISFPSTKSQARHIKAYLAEKEPGSDEKTSINDIESEEQYTQKLYD